MRLNLCFIRRSPPVVGSINADLSTFMNNIIRTITVDIVVIDSGLTSAFTIDKDADATWPCSVLVASSCVTCYFIVTNIYSRRLEDLTFNDLQMIGYDNPNSFVKDWATKHGSFDKDKVVWVVVYSGENKSE